MIRTIPRYIAQFRSQSYKDMVCNTLNHTNPLAFNSGSNNHQVVSYQYVYLKAEALIPIGEWIEFYKEGLFSEEHIIGVSTYPFLAHCDIKDVYISTLQVNLSPQIQQ